MPSRKNQSRSLLRRAQNAITALPLLGLIPVNHAVTKHPNALDLHFHVIARLQRTHAGWRPGRDQVEREQRHHPRNVADDLIEREDEILRIAALLQLAVDACLYLHARPGIDL